MYIYNSTSTGNLYIYSRVRTMLFNCNVEECFFLRLVCNKQKLGITADDNFVSGIIYTKVFFCGFTLVVVGAPSFN